VSRVLSRRDQYVVLVLGIAAFTWRWFVSLRSPLPGVGACGDLWSAAQLAHGGAEGLAALWREPMWSLVLAPAIACGAPPFLAAQAAACVFGSVVVWPVAAAAERFREGAGVPAAVCATVAAGPSVAAGLGSGAPLLGFVVALALWALACGRTVFAAAGAIVAALAMGDELAPAAGVVADGAWWLGFDWSVLRQLRLGIGTALLLAPFAFLPPRPKHAHWPALALLAVLGAGLAAGAASAWLPTWSPAAAVLAGVGLARLSWLQRDVVLCVVVALECHGGWHEIEPRELRAERAVGRFVAHRLRPGQRVLSELPRVLWAAGSRPDARTPAALADEAQDPDVGAVVIGRDLARSSTLAASLARTYVRCELPPDLADLVVARGMRVLIRR
jgi:hypothetical protein